MINDCTIKTLKTAGIPNSRLQKLAKRSKLFHVHLPTLEMPHETFLPLFPTLEMPHETFLPLFPTLEMPHETFPALFPTLEAKIRQNRRFLKKAELKTM
jgi:hypothetical protein